MEKPEVKLIRIRRMDFDDLFWIRFTAINEHIFHMFDLEHARHKNKNIASFPFQLFINQTTGKQIRILSDPNILIQSIHGYNFVFLHIRFDLIRKIFGNLIFILIR